VPSAWAGLAAIYKVAPGWGIVDRDYPALAREAAETAIQLSPDLSLPYAVLALGMSEDWPVDFEQSLDLFGEALARDPKNTTAYLWRTVVYVDLGYFDRAETDALQCLEIDPAYEICRSFLAMAALFAGDTARALEIHKTALRHGFFGNTYPFVHFFMATGEEHTALMAMAAGNAARGVNNATVYEYRALTEPGFDYEAEKSLIDQAYFPAGEGEPTWSDLSYWWLPYPLDFRNSPHRKRLIRDIGIYDYWRKHGFPPQCRPLGNNDFECD
jgi:tetratricopeptide (TPR) repeat protein